MAKKEIDVVRTGVGEPISIHEIGTGGNGIELVNDFDYHKVEDLEAFMNEILVIMVYEDSREGALKIIAPTVNNKRQPILRGAQQKVRRKYVEVLARSLHTKYEQRKRDPFDPASLEMVPMHSQSYPFVVIHDPNPLGRAWLDGIMNEKV